MAEEPQAALSLIRNKLQVILLRAELSQNSARCNVCAIAVSEILKEIRSLEAYVLEALRK
ncbi:MAG: hypothetical protein ACLPHI_22945 [Terriglobales bacterium]|jgi:hypothetical protein